MYNLLMFNCSKPMLLILLISIVSLVPAQFVPQRPQFSNRSQPYSPLRGSTTPKPKGESHWLRITPVFSTDLLRSRNFNKLSNIFNISSAFFNRLLKVPYLTQSQVVYNVSRVKKCGNVFPAQYAKDGFNQETTDMAVFVSIMGPNEPNDGLPIEAYSVICDLTRRVTYGLVKYNETRTGSSYFSIHHTILTSIHEMIHILGFMGLVMDELYVSADSNIKRPESSVFKYDQETGQYFMITPKVRKYVQSYFGCYDGTGALLADAKLNHWDQLTFNGEIMAPANTYGVGALTGLTLAFLQDTGYYSEVNYRWEAKPRWGYRKGCAFARGQLTEEEDCRRFECDYFSRYVQSCDQYGQSTSLPGMNCEDQQRGKGLAEGEYFSLRNNQTLNQYFGHLGRCFNSADRPISLCYRAYCSYNKRTITIQVGNKTGSCNRQQAGLTVKINGITIYCPQNFDAFCSYSSCPNICSGRGVCLISGCICDNGYKGEDCSQQI